MSTAARIEELRKKFDENPRRYFAPLANELRKAGDLTQAIALCREHLPKQPGHMSGYIVFGQALYESGALDESRAVFEQALALDPENLIALHHLGHIAKQQGDTPAARRWYERSLETDPFSDDIALQLASLATPVRSQPAVPTPAVAPPAVPAESGLPGEREPAFQDTGDGQPQLILGGRPTPPIGDQAISALPPAPTSDVSMGAVGFAMVNASLRPPENPEPIDLADDAEVPGLAVPDAAPMAPPASDDPFRFGEASEVEQTLDSASVEPVDLEAAFEEGLVAAGWPDADTLAPRLPTPRSTAAVPVDVPAAAAEAFGREVGDRVPVTVPQPEPDVYLGEADLQPSAAADATSERPDSQTVGLEALAEPDPAETFEVVAVVETLEVEATELVWVSTDAPAEASPVAAVDEVDDLTAEADLPGDLPWLTASRTPVAEVSAIMQALEDDARASGESEDVSVSFSRPADSLPLPVASQCESEAETSFVGVTPDTAGEFDHAVPEAGQGPTATPAGSVPAFVTETMGELLVAQGFVDRAVEVYEELVRRRPYDPVLSARLAELREQEAHALPLALYTARERYAALATRRVVRRTPVPAPVAVASPVMPRRTPSVAAPAVPTPRSVPIFVVPSASTPAQGADESLASLFGAPTVLADDAAAHTLANAFAPQPLEVESPVGRLFGHSDAPRAATPGYSAARAVTPARPATPLLAARTDSASSDFSFDRFFPDPAQPRGHTQDSGPASGEGTSAAAPGAPGAGSDLAQFSQWLKGLGDV
ncbi:tetratricopeptide repeat protein [Gemmatimonas sp.]|uniref:tetratricopeptide repeat protein n=1 Tax=Gemmatimonas sp. TaxID=1962908 RepID=UPI0022BEC876|nr:tetratricopeptide repeat protein [Gemmatimonas sp.]MCZ8205680.1 tetratricopeptide repeat protein [Gemmatimonas sp.]